MISTLEVAFRDTRADDLALTFRTDGPPPRAALARLPCVVAGVGVELCVLSGSHEVRLVSDRLMLSEVVGCGEHTHVGLPADVTRALPAARYVFQSTTDRLAPRDFTKKVQELIFELGVNPRGLLGRFPGHPDAITGLEVAGAQGGVRWRTWHCYPHEGEIVRTESRVAFS
jgi:Protein of unknown function DUF2617